MSLSPAVTEILFAIGAGRHIVCRDQWSDWPHDARSLPALKGHQDIEVAAVAAALPDIVFTSTLVQKALSEALIAAGLPVLHHDPRTIADIYDMIRHIGLLTHADERAHVVVSDMQSGFMQMKRRAGLLRRRQRLYIEEWHHPPMVSGNWVPEVAAIAGAIPFPLPPGSESKRVSLQEVQAFDPDLIVLSICGAGAMAEKRLLVDRVGWCDLRAVAAGRVFVIDDSLLNRPGPRLVEGAQRLYGWLFQVMHQA